MKIVNYALVFVCVCSAMSSCFADKNSEADKQLLKAAQAGNIAQVNEALNKGANIEAYEMGERGETIEDGGTALIKAIQQGHANVVTLLLDKGALDSFGLEHKALIEAAKYSHPDIVAILLAKGARVNAKDRVGDTALIKAAEHGREGNVKLLLDKGAQVDAENMYGETALIVAARNFHPNASFDSYPKVVKLLLDKGADIKRKNKDGATVLDFKDSFQPEINKILDEAFIKTMPNPDKQLTEGARTGNIAQVKAALEKKANINAKDEKSLTALMWAAIKGYTDIVKLLLENGADANIETVYEKKTAFTFASWNGHIEATKLLIPKSDINHKFQASVEKWDTALTFAYEYGLMDMVRLLLDNGADVNSLGGYGLTVLMDAAAKGDVKSAKFFLEKGADVNASGSNKKTALMWGAGHTGMVELLLAAGANVNAQDSDHDTALDYAKNKPEILTLLQKASEKSKVPAK